MDENADQQKGRLRLHRPTFRGSSVGWGIAAVFWLSFAVQDLVGIVQGGGASVGGGLLLAATAALGVVCVIGTVATIRHPRKGPPATDR
ncbi:hypothetical protein ASF17_00310 [Frigoribacterium sp. Leaf263]|uniref:hypothetical protein n=1 Tax=Frigoribacterium sp. Leaf263 TaxID=1736313 RepID=UPI0006FB94CC|nr:hypothetical protein [Frigoribacterium sp. Leaf263]KQO84049.1 hypothetical protein ASF17_00310 [Frigoribacterium sp. Leaf263]